jgi:hypothetical protein
MAIGMTGQIPAFAEQTFIPWAPQRPAPRGRLVLETYVLKAHLNIPESAHRAAFIKVP